jgi:hypothetical protein
MPAPIVELERLPAISPKPHSVAVDGETVYVASRETERIDVIDRASWKKIGELKPPGMPWGMTFGGGQLVMTCGEGEGDNRFVRAFMGGAFSSGFPCPDDTGSHLAVYDGHVLLAQWYNKKLLLLADDGSVIRTYDAPHGVAGVAVKDDTAYLVCTDHEDDGDYWLSTVDLRTGATNDVAQIPFHARGLSFDGAAFWTNHREADRTVTFTLPSAT